MAMRIKSYGYESQVRQAGIPGVGISGANAPVSAFGGAGAAVGEGLRRLAGTAQELNLQAFNEEIRDRESRLAADLVKDGEDRQARTEEWLAGYQKNHQLDGARNAEADFLKYYEGEQKDAQARWGHNPRAMRYVDQRLGALSRAGTGRMRAYSLEQEDLYKERVYGGAQTWMLARAGDPNVGDGEVLAAYAQVRREGAALFAGKDPTERNARLEEAFRKERGDAERKRLAALSEKDPQTALEEVNALRKGLKTGEAEDQDPAPAEPIRKTWLSAEELDLEEARLKARIKENENKRVEACARIERGNDDLLSASLQSGDFSALEAAEAELGRLGNPEAAAGLRRKMEICRKAQPMLRANANLPFVEQLMALNGIFGLGDEDADGEGVRRRMAAAFPGVLYAQAGSGTVSDAGAGKVGITGATGQAAGTGQRPKVSTLDIVTRNEQEKPVPPAPHGVLAERGVELEYKRFHALPPEEQAKEAALLSPEDRFSRMGGLNKKALQSDPTVQREALLFSGLSQEVVARALDPNISLKDFRKSLTPSMLPVDLQKPTQVLIDKSTGWAKKNKEQLRTWNEQWRAAKTKEQKLAFLQTTFDHLAEVMGRKSVPVRDYSNRDSPFVARLNPNDGEPEIAISLTHSAFGESGELTADFAELMGGVIHELTHGRQTEYMIPRLKPGNSFADSLTINYQGFITPVPGPGVNNNPYVAQPIEMQAHIIHNSFADAVRGVLSYPVK